MALQTPKRTNLKPLSKHLIKANRCVDRSTTQKCPVELKLWQQWNLGQKRHNPISVSALVSIFFASLQSDGDLPSRIRNTSHVNRATSTNLKKLATHTHTQGEQEEKGQQSIRPGIDRLIDRLSPAGDLIEVRDFHYCLNTLGRFICISWSQHLK